MQADRLSKAEKTVCLRVFPCLCPSTVQLQAVFTLVRTVDVKKVDVDVKISLSTSILTWDPMEDVQKMVQSIPDLNRQNFDVVTDVKTA